MVQERNTDLKCPISLTWKALWTPFSGVVQGKLSDSLDMAMCWRGMARPPDSHRKRSWLDPRITSQPSRCKLWEQSKTKEMNYPPTFSTETKVAETAEIQTAVLRPQDNHSGLPFFPFSKVTSTSPPPTRRSRTSRVHYPPHHSGGSGGHQKEFPGCWCPHWGSRHHLGPCFWLSANKKIPREKKSLKHHEDTETSTGPVWGRGMRKNSDKGFDKGSFCGRPSARWFTFLRPFNCHKNSMSFTVIPKSQEWKGFTEMKL